MDKLSADSVVVAQPTRNSSLGGADDFFSASIRFLESQIGAAFHISKPSTEKVDKAGSSESSDKKSVRRHFRLKKSRNKCQQNNVTTGFDNSTCENEKSTKRSKCKAYRSSQRDSVSHPKVDLQRSNPSSKRKNWIASWTEKSFTGKRSLDGKTGDFNAEHRPEIKPNTENEDHGGTANRQPEPIAHDGNDTNKQCEGDRSTTKALTDLRNADVNTAAESDVAAIDNGQDPNVDDEFSSTEFLYDDDEWDDDYWWTPEDKEEGSLGKMPTEMARKDEHDGSPCITPSAEKPAIASPEIIVPNTDTDIKKKYSTYFPPSYRVPEQSKKTVTMNPRTWDVMATSLRMAMDTDNFFVCDQFLGQQLAHDVLCDLMELRSKGYFRRIKDRDPVYGRSIYLEKPNAKHRNVDTLLALVYNLANCYKTGWKHFTVELCCCRSGQEPEQIFEFDAKPNKFAMQVIFSPSKTTGQGTKLALTSEAGTFDVTLTFDRMVAFWGDTMQRKISIGSCDTYLVILWLFK